MRLTLALLVLVACGANSPSGDDEHTDYGGLCSVEMTGTLPGVSIEVSSMSCRYRRGEAAVFTYRVTVDASVPAIDVPESNSCDCNHRNAQIDSWVSWTIAGTSSAGSSQQYCLCDTGCCAPQSSATITPQQGTIEENIMWPGRVWQGPSDTGNEPGDYFEVGTYNVTVSFAGYAQGGVTASLPIEIVP